MDKFVQKTPRTGAKPPKKAAQRTGATQDLRKWSIPIDAPSIEQQFDQLAEDHGKFQSSPCGSKLWGYIRVKV